MIKRLLILLLTCACSSIHAQVNIITTICGDTAGYSGDGGPAINACLNNSNMLWLDNFDRLYISDAYNNRIRRIDLSTNIITTVAGKGTVPGTYSGDGGLATNAELFIPQAVFTDSFGNIFISDALNYRIRKVDISTGIIVNIAGNGTKGDSGDNGPATSASIKAPNGLYVNRNGDVFFADIDNNKIKMVNAATGVISTIAGTGVSGYAGDKGPAINARLSSPGQPFGDNAGNIFFTSDDNVIRKISAETGIITTISGTGVQGYSGDGGPATAAKMNQPYGMYIDKQNNIFVAEWGSGTIRRIDGTTGIITTVAGNGTQGFSGDGGPATAAQLAPDGIVVDRHGTMYIADYSNNRIRMVRDTTQDYTGTKNHSASKKELRIYPNPARDELIVEGAEGSEVSIYNAVGGEVYSEEHLKNKTIINTSSLTPAIYILEAVAPSTGLRMTRRFVKE